MMRIAYFINQYPKVSHSFIRREILELENQGVEVTRFSIRRNSEGLVDQQDQGEQSRTHYLLERSKAFIAFTALHQMAIRPAAFIRTIRQAMNMGRRSQVGRLKHLFYFVEACLLGAWIRQFHITHLHAHFGTNSTCIAMFVHMLYGTTFSFTVHGPEEFDSPEALSLGEKITHASFVIAISSFGRSQLFRWCDQENWQKVQIVHCALDSDFLQAERSPVPDNHRLVCVGRLCEQKGQLLLVEAVHRLKEEGISVDLVLAGDGPMRHEIEEMVNRYDLTRHVTITGWISSAEVLDQITASRAMVLPSFAEGLPVVLMEACALRRPVVATYIAGIPELVKEGVNGWLVPAGSVELLQVALIEVLQSPVELLEEMGEKAFLVVSEQHDIRTECAHLKSLFQKVLG